MITDLAECDLKAKMEKWRRDKVEKSEVFRVAYELTCAVNYLHSANIIHRDLKPENILISPFGDVYVTDFGTSRTLEKKACREKPKELKKLAKTLKKD
mmetsp:Transcript_36833/g.56396  ORF Transcript_36833/g.56396 Transcript_36833/m.56396 type:complete len:98 (+) Transcript_36833:418-711(+)